MPYFCLEFSSLPLRMASSTDSLKITKTLVWMRPRRNHVALGLQSLRTVYTHVCVTEQLMTSV